MSSIRIKTKFGLDLSAAKADEQMMNSKRKREIRETIFMRERKLPAIRQRRKGKRCGDRKQSLPLEEAACLISARVLEEFT